MASPVHLCKRACLVAAFLLLASLPALGKSLILNSSFSVGDLGVYSATGITYESSSNKLWLSDSGTQDRIVQVPLTGGSISQQFSTSSLGFRSVEGIATYASGTVVLVDIEKDQIFGMNTTTGALTGTLDILTSGLSGPAGITYDSTDTTYWVVDYATRRVFHLNSSFTVTSSLSTGTATLEGTVFDSTNLKLISIDRNSDKLWKANRDGTSGVSTNLAAMGIYGATGVTWRASDGHVFITDLSAQKKIYELNSSFSIVNSFTLNASNSRPTDVAYDSVSQRLYVTNQDRTDRIFIYETNGTYVTNFSVGNGNSEGLSINQSGNLLVLDYGNYVTEYTTAGAYVSRSTLQQVKPTDGADIAFDGTRYYVPDYLQKRVYAVAQNGTISWSFSTAGFGCNQPEGITYNSATSQLFIIDSSSDRLYVTNNTGTLSASYDLSSLGINYATDITVKTNEENIYVVDIEDDRVYYLSLTDVVGMGMSGGVVSFDGGTLFGFATLGAGPVEVVTLDGNKVAEMVEGITPGDIFPQNEMLLEMSAAEDEPYKPDRSVRMFTTVRVPDEKPKLSFDFLMGEFDETNFFIVLFDGNELTSLSAADKGDSFRTVEIDLSEFAGRTGRLEFFLGDATVDLEPDTIWLDNISVSGIPEPPASFFALAALLAVAAGAGRRLFRRSESTR